MPGSDLGGLYGSPYPITPNNPTAVVPSDRVGGAYGGGGGALPIVGNFIKDNWKDLLGLAAGAAPLFMGQPQGMEELRQLFAQANARSQQAQPLYDALLRMTSAQLPAYAQASMPMPMPSAGFAGNPVSRGADRDPSGFPPYDGSSIGPQDRNGRMSPDGSGGRNRSR